MVRRSLCAFLLAILLTALLFPAACAFASPILFVVSEIPGREEHHDAFIVPLEDPAHIAHARDLIARGTEAGETIVVAKIAAGADGINRNVLADGSPAWSWHVTEFELFADNTIEILDGWPGFIESDVAGWIQNTNGAIGLWNYTITREFGELPGTAIPLPMPLMGGALLFAAAALARLRSR